MLDRTPKPVNSANIETLSPPSSMQETLAITLMFLTRSAVLLATPLAACTSCILVAGSGVLLTLQALHSMRVCLTMTVAAANTWCWLAAGFRRSWHAMEMACGMGGEGGGGGGGGRR